MRDSYVFYTDQLQGEYKDAFHQIQIYVDGRAYQIDSFEDRMMELLDIFLSAQEKGKPVTAITGKNMEQFCRNFCGDYSWRSRLRMITDFLKNTAWWLLVLVCLELSIMLEEWEGSLKNIFLAASDLEIGDYFIGIGIMWFILRLFSMAVRAIMFKVRWLSWKLYISVNVILWIILMVGLFLFYWHYEIGFIHVPLIPMGLVCGVYLLAYYWCNRKRIREEKLHKVNFADMVKAEMVKQDEQGCGITKAMQKQFERKNRWRKRLGRETLDWEAFICRLERDERINRYVLKSYFILPPIIAAGAAFLGWSDGWLEAGSDLVAFLIVILLMEYAAMLLLYKLMRAASIGRWEWVHEQRMLLEKQKDGNEQE